MLPIFSQLSSEAQEALYDSVKGLYTTGEIVSIPNVGDIAKIGGERINSDDSIVFSFGGKLYELTGYYSSYEGTEWQNLDGVYEVKAVETVITVYHKV